VRTTHVALTPFSVPIRLCLLRRECSAPQARYLDIAQAEPSSTALPMTSWLTKTVASCARSCSKHAAPGNMCHQSRTAIQRRAADARTLCFARLTARYVVALDESKVEERIVRVDELRRSCSRRTARTSASRTLKRNDLAIRASSYSVSAARACIMAPASGGTNSRAYCDGSRGRSR
jgi:hypothetical protein